MVRKEKRIESRSSKVLYLPTIPAEQIPARDMGHTLGVKQVEQRVFATVY